MGKGWWVDIENGQYFPEDMRLVLALKAVMSEGVSMADACAAYSVDEAGVQEQCGNIAQGHSFTATDNGAPDPYRQRWWACERCGKVRAEDEYAEYGTP